MKKLVLIAICTVIAFSLAACNNNQQNTDLTNGGHPNSNVANPFVDCASLDEAAQLAGFSMTAPNSLEGYADRRIQAIKNELIQVFYVNGEDFVNEILIRKAIGSEDVSGDYTEYSEVGTIKHNDISITVKGEGGLVNLATWAQDDYTFSIYAGAGLEHNALISLLQAVS